MGTNFYAVPRKPTTREPIHIGKASCGWKFLFQSQNDRWNDPPIIWNTYEECRKWLYTYTIENPLYVILDEYDEVISFDDFFNMVQIKQDEENPDEFTYAENKGGYRFSDEYFC